MTPKKKDNPVSCSVTFKVTDEVKEQIALLASKAGISQPEVMEQLTWAYLDEMEARWAAGDPIPPRPWRGLKMPPKPRVTKPTTKETDETSALSEFLESGDFPEGPEPVVQPAVQVAEDLPASGGGSTPVRRRRG